MSGSASLKHRSNLGHPGTVFGASGQLEAGGAEERKEQSVAGNSSSSMRSSGDSNQLRNGEDQLNLNDHQTGAPLIDIDSDD